MGQEEVQKMLSHTCPIGGWRTTMAVAGPTFLEFRARLGYELSYLRDTKVVFQKAGD